MRYRGLGTHGYKSERMQHVCANISELTASKFCTPVLIDEQIVISENAFTLETSTKLSQVCNWAP